MQDSGGRGSGRGASPSSAIIPPRRASLEEREAFPIDSPETLESPGVPPDLRAGAAGTEVASPARKVLTIALVAVAALGLVVAARFFMASVHRPPAVHVLTP